jgi:hypothetical protein
MNARYVTVCVRWACLPAGAADPRTGGCRRPRRGAREAAPEITSTSSTGHLYALLVHIYTIAMHYRVWFTSEWRLGKLIARCPSTTPVPRMPKAAVLCLAAGGCWRSPGSEARSPRRYADLLAKAVLLCLIVYPLLFHHTTLHTIIRQSKILR